MQQNTHEFVLNFGYVLNVPVGEFGWEEAFQVWRETATLMSGLLCRMWGQSLLGRHPGIQKQNPCI